MVGEIAADRRPFFSRVKRMRRPIRGGAKQFNSKQRNFERFGLHRVRWGAEVIVPKKEQIFAGGSSAEN
jgi:hypothetical protein